MGSCDKQSASFWKTSPATFSDSRLFVLVLCGIATTAHAFASSPIHSKLSTLGGTRICPATVNEKNGIVPVIHSVWTRVTGAVSSLALRGVAAEGGGGEKRTQRKRAPTSQPKGAASGGSREKSKGATFDPAAATLEGERPERNRQRQMRGDRAMAQWISAEKNGRIKVVVAASELE